MIAAGISSSLATEGAAGQPCFARAFQLLPVHRREQVERDQAEMHATASGVEESDVFDAAHCALRSSFAIAHVRRRCACPVQRHQVVQRLRPQQPRVRVHLHPQPAQRVLHQEAHDPVGGEELGRGGDVLAAELLLGVVEPVEDLSLLALVEELVEPADRLVRVPARAPAPAG